MYKCTECGCEYEIKPDFCDCGNDVFEEETEKITETEKFEHEERLQETPPPQKVVFNSKINFEQKDKPKLQISPVSWLIFSVCIVLSFIVLFVWNPESKNTQAELNSEKNNQEIVNKNIPSIDKLWNNAIPKQEIKKQEQKENTQKLTKNEQNIVKIAPKQVQINNKRISAKQTSTKTTQVKKITPQQKVVTKNNVPKKISNTKPQQHKSQSLQQKPANPEVNTSIQKNTQEVLLPKNNESKVQNTISAQEKQEYINYKISLRNTIGRKIDFTKVIGDGSCTVAFKINSSGKLINRSFAKQSSNMTLNDAVYTAVMSTPSFNPPPVAYNNEVLKLNIKFQNGNFEISLQ